MQRNDTAKFTFKIVIAGNIGVGKSNLIKRYVEDEFDDSLLSTIGVDFKIKTEVIDDTKIKIQFWDTAGQEKNLSIAKSYYKNSDGLILVYDLSNRESFNNLNFWLKEINNSAPEDMKIILLGNKNDLIENREVSLEEAKTWAEERGYFFMEVSAKLNKDDCVNKAIIELIKSIRDDLNEQDIIVNKKSVLQKERFSSQIKKKKRESQVDFSVADLNKLEGINKNEKKKSCC